MSNSSYYGGKIAFIKTDNLRTNHITTNFNDFLSDEGNREIARTELQEKDIITTIIGATEDVIARTALVLAEHLPANINQNIVQIRVDESTALPEYVNLYLNTIYGRDYLRYLSRQTEQVNLNCQEVALVVIPKASMVFQRNIREHVIKAYELQQHAKQEYKIAGELLKRIVNIDINCSSSITYKSLKNTLKASGRLDAEYYQEKYQAYEAAILSAKQGYTFVKNEFMPVKEKCTRNQEAYNYVEIGDVDIGTSSVSFNTICTEDLPDNAKIMTQKGDVLVSTVRPNRGAVAILESDDLLVSGAFTVLREAGDYPKEVLQVLLRTSMYRDWLLRFNVGTSYPVIKDEDVLNMPLPLLEDNVKQDVVNKVNESFSLRRQSKQLLEYAKQAVEMALEQGEEVALTWLKEKASALEV